MPNKTKYASVEVIKNGATMAQDLEVGLFMGLCTRKDNGGKDVRFIVLLSSLTTVRIYNLSEYTIVTFETAIDDTSHMTIFTASDVDQMSAIKILELFTKRMESEGRVLANDPDKEIIDVNSYVDFPETVLTPDTTFTKEKARTVVEHTNVAYASAHYNSNKPTEAATRTAGYSYKTTVKEPKVFVIKRNTTPLTTEYLKDMKDRVLSIAAGTYVPEALPLPDCDKIEVVLPETTVSDNDRLSAEREELFNIYC